MRRFAVAALLLLATATASAGATARARALPHEAKKSAGVLYSAASEREKALRAEWDQAKEPGAEVVKQAHSIVAAYETVVRLHPTSGYCDNALWQAAQIERDLFNRLHKDLDKQKAISLFQLLAREYPSSPFARKSSREADRFAEIKVQAETTLPRKKTTKPAVEADRPETKPEPAAEPKPEAKRTARQLSTIRTISRTVLPEIVRVSIELDREVSFRQERVDGPSRLLFDFPSTQAASQLQDVTLSFDDDVIRKIRVGRHPNETTRVVLDLQGVGRYTVVKMDEPYRVVVDCERLASPDKPAVDKPAVDKPAVDKPALEKPAAEKPSTEKPSTETAAAAAPAKRSSKAKPDQDPKPAADDDLPPLGEKGRVSMSRQLGLGISRVVIDPGHGGHDPGAEGARMSEARIVLDIGLRLEKLLLKQSGMEVTLTRRDDVFVPLEERTAIANREHADLFLSIHANASRNQQAHGIESYYLNFATNPEAEAVAARENAVSERTMNNLPEIVRAIALNNKVEESKDFAALVQQAMATRLKQSNKSLKNLGVKQAPFVVLIGAGMPSVLAEVSFVTNRREGQLLSSDVYRQKIAEALCDAILKYRRTLKAAAVVAHDPRLP